MKMYIFIASTMLLRPRLYNDPGTIIPRSHRAYSGTSLRLSRSFYVHHVLTTTIPELFICNTILP